MLFFLPRRRPERAIWSEFGGTHRKYRSAWRGVFNRGWFDTERRSVNTSEFQIISSKREKQTDMRKIFFAAVLAIMVCALNVACQKEQPPKEESALKQPAQEQPAPAPHLQSQPGGQVGVVGEPADEEEMDEAEDEADDEGVEEDDADEEADEDEADEEDMDEADDEGDEEADDEGDEEGAGQAPGTQR